MPTYEYESLIYLMLMTKGLEYQFFFGAFARWRFGGNDQTDTSQLPPNPSV